MSYRIRMFLAAFCVACLCTRADVERLAVIVGNNTGMPGERPLRYASADAAALAALLIRSGTFEKERVFLLRDTRVDQVKSAFDGVAGRVKEIRRSGRQALVIFYYSGHGGAEALHISGNKLSRREVVEWFEMVGGDIRIMILDACESGDFLRSKGAAELEDAPIVVADSLQSYGSIILSASARGEKAQESEEYRGAVFSHHLLNGLDGAADYNADGAVSLMEAFDYARSATRMEKIGGREGAQNPSFDLDLVGESDPILTRIGKGTSRLVLRGIPAGPLEISDAATFSFVNRVQMTGIDSVTLALPAGKYLIAYPLEEANYVASADLTWNARVGLAPGNFRKRPRPVGSAKGAEAWAWNPHGFEVQAYRGSLPGSIPISGIRLAYALRKSDHFLGVSAAFGEGSATDADFSYAYRSARLEAGIAWPLLSVRYARLLGGISAGMARVWGSRKDQRFSAGTVETPEGGFSERTRAESNVYQIGIPVTGQFFLPRGFRLQLGISGSRSLYRERSGSGQLFETHWEPFLGLGLDI